jgi:hypothetical protein
LLAAGLARRLGGAEAPVSLGRLVTDELKRGRTRLEISRQLAAVHAELRATVALPEPLRRLAAITDFPLYLTTMTDGLFARALAEARGEPARVLSSTLNQSADLPAGWEAESAPILFHLFGQIAATPGCALTEEDVLEFVHRLADRDLRPRRLFDLLPRRHLLLLGNSFPDWHTRVFLRTLRGRRVSEDAETLEALADDSVHGGREQSLVVFLRDFGRTTLLYEEGGAADFIATLHERWQAARTPAPARPAGHAEYEPDDMIPGSVFISYRSLDRAAALAFTETLERGGLEVWLDRHRFETGDPFEQKIRRHIQQCDIFVPLISKHTEASDEGFFRREWRWALRRAEAMQRRFIFPVMLDELERGALRGVPEEFLALHMVRAAGGVPPPDLVAEFVAAVRQIRSRRTPGA